MGALQCFVLSFLDQQGQQGSTLVKFDFEAFFQDQNQIHYLIMFALAGSLGAWALTYACQNVNSIWYGLRSHEIGMAYMIQIFLFGEVPLTSTIIGASLIIVSGLMD